MIDDNTGKAISSAWSIAKSEDIGAGFRRANKSVMRDLLRQKNSKNRKLEDVYRRIRYMDVQAENSGRERHPFLNGNSQFIFYLIKPPKLKNRPSTKTGKALNLQNKVSPEKRVKFASVLGTEINKTSKFFIEEILPRSQALMTAVNNVDEILQQLTEEKASLPIEFIKSKSREAISLRIIRFLSSQYGLNKKEKKLMYAEFIARMKPPLF